MFIKGALCNVKYAGCRVGVMFNCSCSCASASVCPLMCICKTRPQCKKCRPVNHQTLLVLIVFLSLSVGSGLFWSSLLQKYWPTLIIEIPFKIVHFGTTVEKVFHTSYLDILSTRRYPTPAHGAVCHTTIKQLQQLSYDVEPKSSCCRIQKICYYLQKQTFL